MPTRRDQNMERGPGRFEIDPNNQRGRNIRNIDPYVFDEGMPEPAVCTVCHAVYRNRRWHMNTEEYQQILSRETVRDMVCPACQKTTEFYPEGIVTLRGGYLWKHEDEILNIVRNTENAALARNPLERIMNIRPEGEALVVETTEEKLAEHIGRALHKAHRGSLHIDWSDDHSFCRVTWERDA